jgi:hypothetical protein
LQASVRPLTYVTWGRLQFFRVAQRVEHGWGLVPPPIDQKIPAATMNPT